MRLIHRLASASLLASGVLALPVTAGSTPPSYTVQFLGSGQGVVAINALATVVGNSTATGNVRAWIAGPDRAMTLLPLPDGMASGWATDINDADVVVGAIGPAYSPEFGGHAAAWVPDGAGGWTVHDLGTLPGHTLSNATAVNNVGDIVGTSTGMFRDPVLYSLSSAPVNLSATGIFDPEDVNDARTIVDGSFTSKLLHLDTMTVEDLGVPPGGSYLASTGVSINEHDEVAGVAILAGGGNCDRLPATYSAKDGWTILGPCGSSNGAYDINELGDVVMRTNVAPWVRFAGVGTFVIQDLIAPEAGTWYVSNLMGAAINDARQIATFGTNPDTGEAGPILLTPIVDGPPADIDGDGSVGFGDVLLLLASWGPCPGCVEDLDDDGVVGLSDLLIVLSSWS